MPTTGTTPRKRGWTMEPLARCERRRVESPTAVTVGNHPASAPSDSARQTGSGVRGDGNRRCRTGIRNPFDGRRRSRPGRNSPGRFAHHAVAPALGNVFGQRHPMAAPRFRGGRQQLV